MKSTHAIFIYLIGIATFCVPKFCRAQSYDISIYAGGGSKTGAQGDGGLATSASLASPIGTALDASGNLYISDNDLNVVRKVTSSGIISPVAGTYDKPGFAGDNGPANAAKLQQPRGLALDTAGNLYIADNVNGRIREVSASTGLISTVAGGGNPADSLGDDGPALSAQLQSPVSVALDHAGNLYILDGSRVRKVAAATGIITTIAGGGNPPDGIGDALPATQANIAGGSAMALSASGNIYIADVGHSTIRKIGTDGIISLVAGNSKQPGFGGDGGPATSARLLQPRGIAVDSAEDLFIADTGNSRVRQVPASTGVINTIAGGGKTVTSTPQAALNATIGAPENLVLDSAGNVYFGSLTYDVVYKLKLLLGTPSVSAGGVVSAGAFGQFTAAAPGSWIEIYGSNLSATTRSWTGNDFKGVNAPTKLDGTTVTIGGISAFIDYISPTQVNAQVPSGVATGSQPLIVTTDSGGASASYSLTVNATEPGLLAPPSFKVGGIQYVAALFSDNVTFVLPPGAIAGVASRRAKPGDTITLYGVGFGPVTPNIPAGQIVQ